MKHLLLLLIPVLLCSCDMADMADMADMSESDGHNSSTDVTVSSPSHNFTNPYSIGDDNALTADLAFCAGSTPNGNNVLTTDMVISSTSITIEVTINQTSTHSATVSKDKFKDNYEAMKDYLCKRIASPQPSSFVGYLDDGGGNHGGSRPNPAPEPTPDPTPSTWAYIKGSAHNFTGSFKVGDDNPLTKRLAACLSATDNGAMTLTTAVVEDSITGMFVGNNTTTSYVYVDGQPFSFTLSTEMYPFFDHLADFYLCNMLKEPQSEDIKDNELLLSGQLDWDEDEAIGSSSTWVPIYSPAHNFSGPYKVGDDNTLTAQLATCTGSSDSSPYTLRTETVSADDFTTLYVFTNNLPSHSITVSRSIFESKTGVFTNYFCTRLSSPQDKPINDDFEYIRLR